MLREALRTHSVAAGEGALKAYCMHANDPTHFVCEIVTASPSSEEPLVIARARIDKTSGEVTSVEVFSE